MNWLRTVPGPGSAIHLDAAKLHLRETGSDQDAVIGAMLAGALAEAEARTSRVLLHSRFALSLNAFPCLRERWQGERNLNSAPIRVPHAPLARVVSIVYTDGAGAAQTLAAASYKLRLGLDPAEIVPEYGYTWPAVQDTEDAITVSYDAGYASVFTADAVANTLTVAGPMAWAVDDPVRVSNSGGALPGGLSANTTYYVKTAVSGVYTLAVTAGGSTIDLTSAGSGTHFIGEIPEGIRAWVLMRLGALYETREAAGVVERGAMQTAPFHDGLLDPYRVYVR